MSDNVIKAKLDIIFKKLFTENTDLLHDFLASTLEIPYNSIKNIIIQNPEILPFTINGKLSRMDIKILVDNRVINIEMQIGNESDYRDRALFLWSKLFIGELKSGEDYDELKQSICINVINFNMFNCSEFHSHFTVSEKTRHEILTDKFVIHFFELKKINKNINKNNKMELWLQLINAETKEELDMLEQTGIAPIQKAVYVLHQMSEDEKIKELAWQREIALHDYASSVKGAKREVARNLLKRNRPIEEIIEDTGLTREEIEGLQ